MKKKVKKAKKKVTFGYLIASTIWLLLGFWVLLSVYLNPTPRYDELKETTTTVRYFYVIHHSKTADDPVLLTTDGKKFYISSKYQKKNLREKFLPGVKVKIKYYERNILFITKRNLAKEITIGNNVICKYRNTDVANMIFISISCCLLFFLPSIVFFLSWKDQRRG